jgi:hypothetical protein
MAISVKKGSLWRRELENRPGSLADSLEHLAKEGVNLQIVTGYCYQSRAGGAVEIFPVADPKTEEAAKKIGFTKAENVPCLIVSSNDGAGVIYQMTKAIADDGINLQFIQSQSMDGKYTAIFGFFSDSDTDRAAVILAKVQAS